MCVATIVYVYELCDLTQNRINLVLNSENTDKPTVIVFDIQRVLRFQKGQRQKYRIENFKVSRPKRGPRRGPKGP